MIAKHLDQIEKSDIDSLITNAVREGQTIEYKEQLPSGKDDDKKEFLADVSSFANASGGDLIFGIEEQRDAGGKTTGIPSAAKGLVGINVDQEIRRLESMIRDGIEPRIPGVQIRPFEGFPNGPVIIVRLPHSWAAPHMVTFKASPRFYSRTSAGKAPLGVPEIRAAFLQSEALPERIRWFREDRLGKILAGETPVPVQAGPKVVLHAISVESLFGGHQIDLLPLTRLQIIAEPMGANSSGGRINLDGYVRFTYANKEGVVAGYSQVFRAGVIEAVDTRLLGGKGERDKSIPSVAFEGDLIVGLREYLAFFSKVGVSPPIIVMISLLGVRGFYMHVDTRRYHMFDTPGIDRDHVLVPEVVIEDLSVDTDVALRPALDSIWQACGHIKSLGFDDLGRWVYLPK